MKYIDLHPTSLTKFGNIDISKLAITTLNLIKKMWKYPLWYNCYKFEYEIQRNLFKNVFKMYEVKLLIQHREVSWWQEAQTKALEESGGIMIGFHWSVYPYFIDSTKII